MKQGFTRRATWLATMALAALPSRAEDLGAQLRHAAALGDSDAVARLIGVKAPLETRDSEGSTALMLATRANHIETARILIEAGADVNAKDRIEDSPYLYAAAEGHLEILRLTLRHGADLKSTNRYGGTGLIPACHHGHVETVYALLKTAIDNNHINNLGWTALLEAVILGDGGPSYIEIVDALLHAGADPRIADRQRRTPLDHARKRDLREITALLEKAMK